ncbi:MAG: hypothetical protein Q9227_002459 [Pyrenula ochraceoflavens]
MPFFKRVFKGKDGTSSKKNAKNLQNGQAAPPKPTWTDAWLRTRVDAEEVEVLIKGCTIELKSRALDLPFLLLPFRPASDPSAARTFIRHFFNPEPNRDMRGEYLMQELRLAEPMVLASVLKWCWARLQGGVVTWDAYELFKVGESDSNFARDAFSTFIPLSVDSDARTTIIFDFFDLMAAIAAHGKANGLGGRKLSRYAGWWAFEHINSGKGFDTGAADATSHLFFAYLRSLSPELSRGVTGIMTLPLSLQQLLQSTEYPPEAPTLMFNSSTKVVMIVGNVSPTPFALLRRAKQFEYRDDDRALQTFSNFDDPVQALTEECRRVLRCISSANQSSVSTSTASTSLKDASWSRFEDIGFGGTGEESDEDLDSSALATKRNARLQETSHSATDLGRPTTPSWADFLSSGFVDESGNKSTGPLLLPPDKVLPPIQTTRVQSSQSHRRHLNMESSLEPGELASINTTDMDDAFWWVWISSLGSEEPTSRKAVFGRCALVETTIPGGKWLIMEEQVKGAAPEPGPGARIAEKKGLFGFSTRRNKVSRAKSEKKKNALPEEPYNQDTSFPMSKSSIGPDQHARIQRAAAALQEKNRQQDEALAASVQTNGVRRGRADDAVSTKTASVFTLQPVIMSEASQAMKWANQYDKNAIRARYLGDNLAGRGGSTEMLTLPPNGMNRSTSALGNREVSPARKNQELPPPPKETESRPPAPSPGPRPEDIPLPSPTPQRKVDSPAIEKEEPMQAPPSVPPEKTKPRNAEAAEAAKVPLPAPEKAASPDVPTAEGASSEPLEKTTTQSPGLRRPSEDTSRDPQRKLQKKPRPGGFKLFGKKKGDGKQASPVQQSPSSPPADSAVAAARAALEGRTPPKAQSTTSPTKSKAPTSRFSAAGVRRKAAPTGPVSPVASAPPEQKQPAAPENAVRPSNDQGANTYPDGRPKTDRDEEYDQLSRVSTNEKENADREFSRFDQGPLDDQPAFVPADTPNTGHLSEIPSEPQEREDESPQELNRATTHQEGPPGEAEDLSRQISPQDRWAQIRKNAAERAARQSEEQSRAATERTDDGETSGEETIESRVARIKARVAELTGNMENARR